MNYPLCVVALCLALSMAGCDSGSGPRRSCGRASCDDTVESTTVTKCLADAFAACQPATGAITAPDGVRSYVIDGCVLTVSTETEIRVCERLSVKPLLDPSLCPWIVPQECGPAVGVETR